MNEQLIHQTYSETKEALGAIFKKRRSTQFFQKVMWMITGLYLLLMLLIMAINYFPSWGDSNQSFLKILKSISRAPYTLTYCFMILVVLLSLSTTFFVNRFQKLKIAESALITKMIKRLFPKVDFAQGTMAPTAEILKSKLFAWMTKDSPVFSYGQIRTKVNHTEINITDVGIVEQNLKNKFNEILLRIPILNMVLVLYQYVLRNMLSDKSADNMYYTFRGMFCWLKFNKKLSGHTIVLPKDQMIELDRLATFNFKEEQKVNLEDPRFMDEFVVYSSDQVEARYVLPVSIMERIVSLKAKFNRAIYLSFQNQQMFLAVKNDNGLFSFPAGKLERVKIIEELANDINTALEIGAELKLR